MRQKANGFSLIELLIVVAIIIIILAIAIPNAITIHKNTSETIVIRVVQTIYQAQTQYMSQFGHYAKTLAELGPPTQGSSGPNAASLIPRSLASGEKNGYIFTLTSDGDSYHVNAKPKVFGQNGRRTFFIDPNGVVHQNWTDEPATENSPELK